MLRSLSLNFAKYKLLFILIAVAVAIRFILLDRIPFGISNDELEYVLSAKTYAVSGVDITGVSFPSSIFKTQTEGSISIIPPLLLSTYFKILPLTPFTARLPYALVNILTAYLVYELVKTLFKDKSTALLGSFLFLINPWSFYLSRYAADVPFALLFYVAGITVLLKHGKVLLSLILFIAGFFSYHGAQPIFLPIVIITMFFKFNKQFAKFSLKSFTKNNFWVFLVLPIAFFVFYFVVDKSISGSATSNRSGEIFLLNDQYLGQFVDQDRKLSIESPINSVVTNKVTKALDIAAEKYLTAFSADVLFIHGDPRAAYRFEDYGLFYQFDFIFIFAGLIFCFINSRKVFWFLLSLILVAPLATTINRVETSVINRSFMLLPILIIMSSLGMSAVYKYCKDRAGIIVSSIATTCLIGFFAIGYLSFYFLRYPISHQETYLGSETIAVRYLELQSLDKPTVILTEKPRATYLRTIFYLNNQDAAYVKNIPASIQAQHYQIGNIYFEGKCQVQKKNVVYVIERKMNDCQVEGPQPEIILDQKDASSVFTIYNGNLCKEQPLNTWNRFHYINDFALSSLDRESFCNRWIASKAN